VACGIVICLWPVEDVDPPSPPPKKLPDCVLSAHYRQHVQHINLLSRGGKGVLAEESGVYRVRVLYLFSATSLSLHFLATLVGTLTI